MELRKTMKNPAGWLLAVTWYVKTGLAKSDIYLEDSRKSFEFLRYHGNCVKFHILARISRRCVSPDKVTGTLPRVT
jgi:hypothetical protein